MFGNEQLKAIRLKKMDWQKLRDKEVSRFPERKKMFKTDSQIELNTLYTPEDCENIDYNRDIGFPGIYPYTRGVYPNMYRGRMWTMRQYSGFGTAEESNQRYKYLLKQGQTGLSIAFDLPTQIGLNSDDLLSEGEVGKVGVAIDSLADMEKLFEGIPLDQVSTSMTINAPAAVLIAMYIVVAEKQGVSPNKLNGTIQNDILKEYIARGTYIFPPKPSLKLITDTFEFCSKEVPNWNLISVGAYHIREAGSTAVQEVAFSFANAITYIEAAIEAGLDVDNFAHRISWIFNTYNNFFEEVAKYRAARRLWAKIMKERFGATNPKSCMFRIHIQNGGSCLTAQQPLNNIVRGTIHALASVLGGTQSLAICSYDEALSLPSEESVQLSLRTQQIIAHESGVTDTVDPLAGSYFIESLTNEIEKQVIQYLEKIDGMGGALAAIEAGYMQKEIQDASYQYQMEIEDGSRTIVGLNKYTTGKPAPFESFKIDESILLKQKDNLMSLRKKRDHDSVEKTLAALKDAATAGEENLMPFILDTVRAYATLGEICSVLKVVYGEYQPIHYI